MSRKAKRPAGHAPSKLVPQLLAWFATHARDLPWRRTLDPYAVWVSEIMLQQTQVKTVIPYFERWMRELPDVASLARASSEKIHKLWEGLGYYTRVRNMQKAAQVRMTQHDGKFPTKFDDVLALPGIGRYTAGAICSIAFDQPTPILDGNVIRVLARLFAIRENPRDKETNSRLWKLAEELVTAAAKAADGQSPISNGTLRGNPQLVRRSSSAPPLRHSTFDIRHFLSGPCSALNQSLMELGALVCTPRQPRCEICPLAKQCVARREGLTECLPNLGERPTATARRFVACVLERDGAFLLRQRAGGVVNAHLWEFPNVEVPAEAGAVHAQSLLESELGCALASLAPFTTVKHTITRYRITLQVVRGEVSAGRPHARAGRWIGQAEMEKLPFTSAHRRVLTTLRREIDARGMPAAQGAC